MAHLSRSEALLERVRRRERLIQAQRSKLSPAQLQRNAMLSRLPEIVHCLLMHYNATCKRVHYLDDVGEALAMSTQRCKLSPEQARLHVRLLASIVPDMLKVMDTNNGRVVVRVDKGYPQREALQRIQHALKTPDVAIAAEGAPPAA
jgi:hypothetical protein